MYHMLLTSLFAGTHLAPHTACGLWSNAFLMIGFALLHSGLANCGFFKRFAGPDHRCLYNVTSCAYILVRSTVWVWVWV